MKQNSVVVMSEAERREKLRNRIYSIFPVISILLLILLWFVAAGAENSTFPSPMDIWNRFLLLMEKPIKDLNLFGHICNGGVCFPQKFHRATDTVLLHISGNGQTIYCLKDLF